MPYYGLHRRIKRTDKRQKRWAKQRKERGFDDTELWNLDCTIIEFVLPRLKAFRKLHCGIPGPLEGSPEKWNEILDQIIEGFSLYKATVGTTREDGRKINKAFRLFFKWFGYLWS